VVTPGTVTEEAFLEDRRDTLLAAIHQQGTHFGLAWLELSSGRFSVLEADGDEALRSELERLRPAEVLIAEQSVVPSGTTPHVRERPLWHFDLETATRLLCEQFTTLDLSGFGCAQLERAICAAGCLLYYVRETQKAALPHVRGLRTEQRSDAVLLDAATRLHARGGARPHCHCDGRTRAAALAASPATSTSAHRAALECNRYAADAGAAFLSA
jgi:DNA mismatch repair protein MutS